MRPSFECMDCSVNTCVTDEYYMIHDVLWKQVTSGRERKKMLCVDCVERRLGRSLNSADFKACELTRQKITKNEKLMSRYCSEADE